MSEWKDTTFGEIVTFQRGHDLTQVNFSEGKYIVAGSNGPIGYHNEFTTKGPGLTIGRSGNSIGVAHYYENDFWAHNTTLYSKEFHNSHPKYVYYLLKTFNFSFLDGGSAVPTLNRNHVHTIELKVPSYDEQQSIASILSSLDNKIDLLRRQNQTLEQLAQTIFKQWFVHYQYPGATGEMETTELGDVPKGWRMGLYSDIADVYSGKGLKQSEFFQNGLYPVLGANGELGRTNQFLTDERLILTGRVGTLGIVSITNNKVWISDNVLISKPKNDTLFYFTYYSLKRIKLQSLNRGSTQPLITQSDIKALVQIIPDTKTIKLFDLTVSPLFLKNENNQKEIQTLTQLRDSLLPRLMSGRLRVG